ncbi:MerR family transcriptional regulator [Caulobacter sp. S45]|uniref:MerR family transcriptional regulator n=1 Tax=Caulobacter sp. S45 TaxID=1641861 RepID=UPI00131DF738|nr:MerR family transcriptional regulator [Caulobacter sp. S45]
MSQKLYTISELAFDLGVSARAIRYCESKGLVSPKRLGPVRVFTTEERKRLRVILRMKRLGFSLNRIKTFLDQQADLNREDHLSGALSAVRKCIAKEKHNRL